MKRLSLLVAILLVIGLASYGYAEQSATGMSGKSWAEQQVFSVFYNGSGTDITSNAAVILDTTNGASGSTLGAYITTATASNSGLVVGVTDQVIVDGKAGRVCVRGPHKVIGVSGASLASVGSSMSIARIGAGLPHQPGAVTTAPGVYGYAYATGNAVNIVGYLLDTGPVTSDDPGFVSGENPTCNFWIWVIAQR